MGWEAFKPARTKGKGKNKGNGWKMDGAGKGESAQEQEGWRAKTEDKLKNRKQKVRDMQEKTQPDRTESSVRWDC